MSSVFLHSEEMERYGYPAECPFDTSRAARTRKTLLSMGLLSGHGRREEAPVKATRAELELYHTGVYLDALLAAQNGELSPDALAMGLGTPDCPVFKGMYDYASLAAGASLTGARLILSGRVNVAFNPSGGFHHAGPAKAAGFCYVNDIVLASMVLAEAGRRICFLDLDVHHCDGVQDAFYERSDVMTLSMHEDGRTLFPGTGREGEIGVGEGRGYCVNLPLPVGTYDAIYEKAFNGVVLPLLRAYDPDVIVLELGMDTLSGDPLAHLNLTNNVLADIIGTVLGLGKPILATGGGGYNVENTVRGWALAWSVLCGAQSTHDDMSMGMGGVMLETTEWFGGLRDRALLSDAGQRGHVDEVVLATMARARERLFPLHGLT